MLNWYLELRISNNLNKKIDSWENKTGNEPEDLIVKLLEEYFKENKGE